MSASQLYPRPEVLATPPDRHGALDYEELERAGLDPARMLDFSVNSNPYGPPPGVWDALRAVPLDRYPDRESLALRRALAARLDVPVEQIVTGNGTAELIWLTAMAFVRPGDRVLVIAPTFGEYARAAGLMGGQVEAWRARPEEGFAVHVAQVDRALESARPRIAYLCSPNNPTGVIVPPDALRAWAGAHPRTLFVVDQAYIQFVAGSARAVCNKLADNVLVLRSMTKDYALAGLRLGYAVGGEAAIALLARVRPPWSVNALAQAAGVAALGANSHLAESMVRLRQAKRALVADLEALSGELGLGWRLVPSATNYFLVRVGDGRAVRHTLMSRHVLVRDCASFGLPKYVRIASRTPEENARLLEAIREAGR